MTSCVSRKGKTGQQMYVYLCISYRHMSTSNNVQIESLYLCTEEYSQEVYMNDKYMYCFQR